VFGLFLAQGREVHVNATAEDPVIASFDFTVPNQVEAGG
jgi:hypothetical protein